MTPGSVPLSIAGRSAPVGSAMRRRPAIVPVGAILSILLLSACANVLQGAGNTGAGGTQDPGSRLYDHATGAEDVLVSIRSGGGFSPVEYNLRNVAQFLLLGDGTAIVGGVTIAIYPGPALSPLQTAKLSEGQIQELLAAADDAGLLEGEIDFGEPGVTDLETTTLEITVDGHTVTQSAYALGFNDDAASGLNETEITARAGLSQFIEKAQGMVGSDSSRYEPTGIVAYRLIPDETAPLEEPGLDQSPLTWPIATAPPAPVDTEASIGTCTVISGEEVAPLLDALGQANEITPWLIGTDPPAQMVFRPYLPGDPGCE